MSQSTLTLEVVGRGYAAHPSGVIRNPIAGEDKPYARIERRDGTSSDLGSSTHHGGEHVCPSNVAAGDVLVFGRGDRELRGRVTAFGPRNDGSSITLATSEVS